MNNQVQGTRDRGASATTARFDLLERALWTELVRFWMLRSVRYTALSAVLVFGGLMAVRLVGDESSAHALATAAFAGADTAPLVLGLAALVFIAGDLATGHIGTTLLAMPSRALVVAAKLTVMVAAGLAFGILSAALALGGLLVRTGVSDPPTIDLPHVWHEALLTTAVALCFIFLGAGFGLLCWRTSGAVLAFLSAVFVLPVVGAVVSIWTTSVASAAAAFSPAILTVAVLEQHDGGAFLRFCALDTVLVGLGVLRFLRSAIR